VTFLAYPGLIDVSQYFSIMAIGLALCAIIMGVNGTIDVKLSDFELRPELLMYAISASQKPKTNGLTRHATASEIKRVAEAIDRQFRFALLAAVCFLLSVLVFTTYSIYGAALVTPGKTYTIKYLFFSLATGALVIMAFLLVRWNSLVS
jgi:hypothetical protein